MLRTLRIPRLLGASFAAVALIAIACQDAQQDQDHDDDDEVSVQATLDAWPESSKDVANQMIAEYGDPDEFTGSMLIWYDNGPWLRTIVHRDAVQHDFPTPHLDILEQTIPYQAPLDKYNDLAEYNGSVVLERTNGQMVIRSDREETSFLALNLANDVAQGARTVNEARAFFNETMMALDRGETPPYTQDFTFDVPPPGSTADPDAPAE